MSHNKMQNKSKIKGGKATTKMTFHGGSPDAVKREPPKGKGKKKTMKMK